MQAETYERNGLQVEIKYQEDAESPREWDNIGVMICSHRRYNLGDEQFDPDEYEEWDDLKKHLIDEENAVAILPLGLYDHSGITMYTGTRRGWDSGQVGFIYVTKEMALAQYGKDYTVEMLEEVLKSEVATYDQYLIGEVYGYTITNPKTEEEIDSCWGFYGIDSAKNEANNVADNFTHPHEAAYAKKASKLHQ